MIEPKLWKEQGKEYLYKHKYKIFYRFHNSNREVVLLLHGFPSSSWDWNKVWSGLTEVLDPICLDFIGFGYSDKPLKYKYSVMDQANLVEELLNELDITSIHVLAHDFGDTVLQELLARQLEFTDNQIDIKSVCLLNGGILQAGNHPRPIQKLLASPIGFMLTPILNKALLKRNFDRIFGPNTKASEKEIDAFYELIIYKSGKRIISKTIKYLQERKEFQLRWESALSNYNVPLIMINGLQDPVSGERLVNQAQFQIPNMEIIRLKEIGHYPQTEAPDLVLDHYLQFVKQNLTQ